MDPDVLKKADKLNLSLSLHSQNTPYVTSMGELRGSFYKHVLSLIPA